MGFMDNILDWAADKVQTVTGEKERRQLVQELKNKYIEFKDILMERISILNTVIKEFNNKIRNLNTIREQKVRTNIEKLHNFLGKFGNDAKRYFNNALRIVIFSGDNSFAATLYTS